MPRHQQIIAVVIKQYGTGLYRTCVSMGKENVMFLGAYRDERAANEKINQFWKAYDEGEIKRPEDLRRLMAEPAPALSPLPPLPPVAAAEQIFTPLAA